MKPKLVRITTVPISMNIILRDQLHFMNQFYEVTGVTGYDEKHFNEIKEREGVKMQVVEMARPISPLKDLKALWDLFKLLKKEKPDIVHTHTPKAGLLGMVAARFAGIPVRLHTVAGLPLLETEGAKRTLLNLIERFTYSCAHTVYPNSYGLKKVILENSFCPEWKVRVLGNGSSNGIDTDYFSPEIYADDPGFANRKRAEHGVGEEDFVFCFVGRLAREKGIKELIDAFESLQHRRLTSGNIKLLLVGPFEKVNGVLEGEIHQKIYNNPDVLYVGRHDDIRPFLYMSDVFVFPSYREGFPGVVLQACAMGLACIVTNINGCNEIIQENKNGITVEPKNTDQLRQAMEEILENEGFRKSLASNARKIVVKQFKREFIWEALLNEYNSHMHKYNKI